MAFLVHVGSTGAGFISPAILSILSIILTVVCVGVVQGWDAMLKHWWETALITAVVLVTAILAVYGPQFIWQAVKLAREDRQTLAASNSELFGENQSLARQLKDSNASAEQRCEAANGSALQRCTKQLNAVCYLPDRHFNAEQREYLFTKLKSFADSIKRQNRSLVIEIIAAYPGDRESRNFVETLEDIFNNAGWTVKRPQTYKEGEEAKEREYWISRHETITGVSVVYPTGAAARSEPATSAQSFGMSLNKIVRQPRLAPPFEPYTPSLSGMPYLDNMMLLVGYKVYP